jgi:DNA-directed RNA polymerase specialized sigma24 family protein
MSSRVTEKTFSRFLALLDPDRDRAGAKYEDLRRVLTRFFEWRGAAFPDEHVDDTFDRVARRLDEGIPIANAGAYCYEVARLVWLESLRAPDRRRVPLAGDAALLTVESALDEQLEHDRRVACLRRCLAQLPEESRVLILEYYRDGGRGHIDYRRALADRLGVPRDALANRAQRVRNKLETCVARCVGRSDAI